MMLILAWSQTKDPNYKDHDVCFSMERWWLFGSIEDC